MNMNETQGYIMQVLRDVIGILEELEVPVDLEVPVEMALVKMVLVEEVLVVVD